MENKDTDTAAIGAALLGLAGVVAGMVRRWLSIRAVERRMDSGLGNEVRLSYELALKSLREEVTRMREERQADRAEIDELRDENAALQKQVALLGAQVATLTEKIAGDADPYPC